MHRLVLYMKNLPFTRSEHDLGLLATADMQHCIANTCVSETIIELFGRFSNRTSLISVKITTTKFK